MTGTKPRRLLVGSGGDMGLVRLLFLRRLRRGLLGGLGVLVAFRRSALAVGGGTVVAFALLGLVRFGGRLGGGLGGFGTVLVRAVSLLGVARPRGGVFWKKREEHKEQ